MATVYKVKVVSDFIAYTPEQMEAKLKQAIEALEREEREKGNTIRLRVEDRQ